MGNKNHKSFNFNWSSTNPAPFTPSATGGSLSGVVNGVMTGTNTIYSNVMDLSLFDNEGLEITWTGTPTGTITVNVSESGVNFYALTFNPSLTQPAGSAGGYAVNLNQIPWRYMYIKYVNASGSGTLNIWMGSKDLN